MTKFKNFIKANWELPQNIIGFIIKTIFKTPLYTTYKDVNVYSYNFRNGVSFGKYIFVPHKEEDPEAYLVQRYIKHEYGHSLQSRKLGWLYLIVIGLPSVIWNACFDGYRKKHNVSYYDFYTEAWADKLGGVER